MPDQIIRTDTTDRASPGNGDAGFDYEAGRTGFPTVAAGVDNGGPAPTEEGVLL
ncbi:hypothetical protein [Jannaschia marina]|uniref:hypothetical protein n=1 Tax=Jannaschia marina TaxID=2741674 RepID=UPI0015CB1AFB|nr:hypothetical protein [Jannaschia marina]